MGGELRDCPTEGCTKPAGHKSPCGILRDLTEAEVLEQAGSFGPLSHYVVADEAGTLTSADLAALREVTPKLVPGQGQVYATRPADHPNAPEGALLLEPVASSPNVARAFREEQLRLQAEAAQQAAAAEAALVTLGHLRDTQGLALRREPDESGSPRFTLLGLRVGAGGQASVEVLVPVAPWHHVHDFIERHLRTTLTPREYQ